LVHSPVLVTYSTRTGSTGEVAEFITAELRRAGIAFELARMSDVKALSQYRAVILGAPIYLGKLPAEVLKFLRNFELQIAELPAWFYVLGPIRGKPWEYRDAEDHAKRRLAKLPWFQPREVKVFGGRLDPNHMPFPFSLAVRIPGLPFKSDPVSDVRDWDDIRSWTMAVVDEIDGPVEVEPPVKLEYLTIDASVTPIR
jgi:menaquinone-dependent protoporphyrinogen oxidase